MNWATVTVRDSTGKRYSLDVQAESTYAAAHLFLRRANEHVIRDPSESVTLHDRLELLRATLPEGGVAPFRSRRRLPVSCP